MRMWNLNEAGTTELLDLPETGMGFQLVEALALGETRRFLVFNAERALDLADIKLESGDDPLAILRNGLRIMESVQKGQVETFVSAPAPHSFRLLGSRISFPGPKTGVQIVTPSSLVKRVTLSASRVFHRFSAFNPDRRVNPVTGSFLAGTYAAPQSEVAFVPTGFVGVGRFALPNNLPASHHYEIDAPFGTVVDFGTVTPAFGQAGGGVEAYFQNAVTNAKVPPAPTSQLPDE
jgi:hypothetical protein